MAAPTTLVPLNQYLKTTYRPDRDYLEGELQERNMGEQPHSRLQGFLGYLFRLNQKLWNVRALPEQRVQVRRERFRIPDLSIIRSSDPFELIITKAPLLCIEVLSSDDSLRRIHERVKDYAEMGVANIWVVDPWSRVAYYASSTGFQQVEGGVLRVPGTLIEVTLSEMFAELDDN